MEGALENLTLAALYEILPQGLLVAELVQRVPTTLQEFMDKTEEFIIAEETIWVMVKSKSGSWIIKHS